MNGTSSHGAAEPLPMVVEEAVMVKTGLDLSKTNKATTVGYDFNEAGSSSDGSIGVVDYEKLLNSYLHSGFQAQHYGQAVKEIQRMLDWSLAAEPIASDEEAEYTSLAARESVKCKIFLAYTSNLISAGLRETLRYLFQHRLIHVATSSAGGIEEDIIKCLAPTYEGNFELDGVTLRKRGLNRIGNLIVPNDNYCLFEDWIRPILDAMHDEQENDGV